MGRVLAIFLLAFGGAGLASRSADEPVWETDLEAAGARATAEGKPLLVVFRCPP